MDSTFVQKISLFCTTIGTPGVRKAKALKFERLILLLINFLYTCFNPACRLFENHPLTLPTPPGDAFRKLAAGTDFR